MRVLIALTYFRPHISGLTIYVERFSRALAARGHQVTILTSQYDPVLPRRECLDGVEVVRVPVVLRISKGVIMPTIGWEATRLALAHEVLNLHLPQFDASGIALRGRLFHRPVVLTYHLDLALPPSFFHWLAGNAVNISSHVAIRLADAVVTNTADFAKHSSFLSRFSAKINVIPPPVEMPKPTPESTEAFRGKFHLETHGPIIGIVARLAAEKGIEYLLKALPYVIERFPEVSVLHVGPHEPVGEAAYARQLDPLLERYRDQYRFIGVVSREELAAFLAICDVLVLPSVNSTESFGMVQIEAALCGTPSVATDLPGVREATRLTGMGFTVPPRDVRALAEGICNVLSHPETRVQRQAQIAEQFSPANIAARYEQLFERLLER
ncbi:MAG: glycosyltransferase family 4 protein [Chloroflexota bacterium]|nr:glycosyltransferase family 4 protein [Chloroflexota bacterium]